MSIKRYHAESEYKKDKNIRKDVVLEILDWVHGQPHLPKVKEEDVIAFLTACLYSSEVTKQTLDLNYTYRTHIPEMFANRDPLNTQTDLLHKTMSYCVPLPGLTEDGYKVLFIQMKPENSSFNNVAELRAIFYAQDHMLYEEGAQQGWRIIVDMSNTPLSILTQLSPSIIIKASNYAMHASAVRMIGIHMIYPPSYMDLFLNFIKSIVSKEIMELFKIHSNLEDLYKYIPKTILPSTVGGDLEELSILHERYRKRIIENRDYFKEEEQLRVDESLRPGKATSVDTLFGVTGSFRKLDID